MEKFSTAELLGPSVPVPPVPASAPPQAPKLGEALEATAGSQIAVPVTNAPAQVGLHPNLGFSPNPQRSLDVLNRFSSFGRGVLRVCDRLDQGLAGSRFVVLVGAAVAASVVGPAIDYLVGSRAEPLGPVTAVFTVVFLVTCWLLAFAFAGSLRNENGGWQGDLVWLRVRAAYVDVRERFREFAESTKAQKGRLWAWLVLTFAVAILALSRGWSLGFMALSEMGYRSPLAGKAEALDFLGWSFFALGSYMWWVFRSRNRATRVALEAEVQVSSKATFELPPIISLNGGAVEFGQKTLIHEVLAALSKWRARTWESERQYQDSLQRHFERHIPHLKLKREERFGPARNYRADFVVADAIVLELKVGLRRKTEVNRMEGQMGDYHQYWPERPAILVVFEASEDELLRGPFTSRLEVLHARQPMLTVRMPVAKRAYT